MAKIDELINAAQKSVDDSSEEEKPNNEAYLKALQDAKEANVTLSQDEVNSIVSKEADKATSGWKEALGMDLEEAQQILADMNGEDLQGLLPDSPDAGGESGGEEGDSFAQRVRAALGQRDETISNLEKNQQDFQRKYYDERIQNRLADSLRAEGLQDNYLAPAKRLSDYSALVDAAMNGEEPTEEKVNEIVSGIKEMSPVWFQKSEPEERVRPLDGEPPVPRTPEGGGSSELTDQQRMEQSSSPFR